MFESKSQGICVCVCVCFNNIVGNEMEAEAKYVHFSPTHLGGLGEEVQKKVEILSFHSISL